MIKLRIDDILIPCLEFIDMRNERKTRHENISGIIYYYYYYVFKYHVIATKYIEGVVKLLQETFGIL